MGGLDWVQVDVGFPMSLAVVCVDMLARELGLAGVRWLAGTGARPSVR